MTFEQIQHKAIAEWRYLEDNQTPRIYINTSECGRSSGALQVLEQFKVELEQRNINAELVEVGCIGSCSLEPLVFIAKRGRPRIGYSKVTLEIVSQLVTDYLVNDNPRTDLAIGTIGEGRIDGLPDFFELPIFRHQVKIVTRNCGIIDPANIDHYIANGGYSGLAKVLSMPPEQVIEEVGKSGLLVNLDGERFFNEEVIQNNTFAGNAISGQKNRCAFMILDETAKKYYLKKGFDQLCYDVPIEDASNFDSELQSAIADGCNDFFVADTLEELAEKAGINVENLKKTVAEYNKACESRDSLFNKNYKYLKPIKKAKFYAGRLVPSGFGSLGGIKINYKAEVVDEGFEVIPGLYAAGTDANSIHSDSYTFIMPGNTMGFAINSGRIAGESAAEYVETL